MDWTIFWTISWTMFWTIFWTILKGEHTISGVGVGGGCNSKHYWLIELLLDRKNYFNWFFD